MHRAGTAQPGTTAELAALQIEFVAQNPQQRHLGIDVDRARDAVDVDRESHVRHSWSWSQDRGHTAPSLAVWRISSQRDQAPAQGSPHLLPNTTSCSGTRATGPNFPSG